MTRALNWIAAGFFTALLAPAAVAEDRAPSPLLAEAPRIDRELAAQATPPPAEELSPLRLSAAFAWVGRASTSPSIAEYGSGPAVEITGIINLTSWLGVRLGGSYEAHTATLGNYAAELGSNPQPEIALSGLTLGASLEPRWTFATDWTLFAGVGIAWVRVGSEPFTLETTSGGVPVRPRTGVLLEYPLSLGLGYRVWGPVQLVLRGRYAPRSNQTGELFGDSAGGGQTVAPDTGNRVTVPGVPRFAPALSALLGLEWSL